MNCHADAADAVASRWVSVAGQLRVPLNCSAVYLECVLFDPAAAGSSLRLAFGSARLWDISDVAGTTWRTLFFSLSTLVPWSLLRSTPNHFAIRHHISLWSFSSEATLRFHFSLNMARIENCICSVAYRTSRLVFISKSFRVVAAIYWHVYATFGSCL